MSKLLSFCVGRNIVSFYQPAAKNCGSTCDLLPLLRLSSIRLTQRNEIELFHFEERLRHTRDLLRCAVAHHFIQLGRNNLPREAEFVLEPSALLGFRNGG